MPESFNQPQKKPRLMVVEDESLIAEDLSERLQKLGYEVCARADTGREAIALFRRHRPDLILMDIHLLDKMDGVEAARQIRSEAGPPVIFVTAHADDTTLRRIGESAPYGYVLKPFEERELKAAIETAFHRQHAENRALKMERWLSTALGNIGDGVAATDQAGRITFLNSIGETITGCTGGAALGQLFNDVFSIQMKDDGSAVNDLLSSAIAQGGTIHSSDRHLLRKNDGRTIPMDDSVVPIRDENGAITGCVMVFRDTSQRRDAEEAQRKLEQKMQEAQRLESLGVLAAGIAHDFNNLLHAITSNASLADAVPDDPPIVHNCLEEIQDAAQRAAQLCSQMLAYAGQGRVQKQDLDLSSFTRDTIQLARSGLDKNATLHLDLADGLPIIGADRAQLQQVVMNLLTNASEALDGRPGEITVRTVKVELDAQELARFHGYAGLQPGAFLLLEVADTGRGMDAETQTRVFDPFFTTKFAGRGLGLAAVLGIVRTHQGGIALRSTPGGGTVFQAIFSASQKAATEPKSPAPKIKWTSHGRVLLADDELALRLAGKSLLQHLGFEVTLAENGRQVVEIFGDDSIPYRLLILDLTMPELDGRHTFEIIRAAFPNLPILLVSGYADDHTEFLNKQSGPTKFLHKPFAMNQLAAMLKAMLHE